MTPLYFAVGYEALCAPKLGRLEPQDQRLGAVRQSLRSAHLSPTPLISRASSCAILL
jgi:hypothetical protein